jgi:hypothetical protein
MQDDELFALMKKETPYLPDSGFSERVLEALPARRRFRIQILSASFAVSIFLAFGIWFLSPGSHGMSAISSPLVLSTASVAFWSFLSLFAFVTVNEDIFEI